MEQSINKRLAEYVAYKKLDGGETQKQLGIRRQAWYDWLQHECAIPLKMVQKILFLFSDLDARWLMTGEGTMLGGKPVITAPQPLPECEKCVSKQLIIDSLNDHIVTLKRTIDDKQRIINLGQKG